MNRARHFAHALAGLAVIAGVGVLLAQKSVVDGMRHNGGEKAAVAGVIIVLALFVVVSLARAVMGAKPAGRVRPVLPYAAPRGRK